MKFSVGLATAGGSPGARAAAHRRRRTVFVQLGIFLLLMLVLGQFLWKPYLRVRTERVARVEGYREEAVRLEADAQQRLARADAALAEARRVGAGERAVARAEAHAREQTLLAEATAATQRKLAEARARWPRSSRPSARSWRPSHREVAHGGGAQDPGPRGGRVRLLRLRGGWLSGAVHARRAVAAGGGAARAKKEKRRATRLATCRGRPTRPRAKAHGEGHEAPSLDFTRAGVAAPQLRRAASILLIFGGRKAMNKALQARHDAAQDRPRVGGRGARRRARRASRSRRSGSRRWSRRSPRSPPASSKRPRSRRHRLIAIAEERAKRIREESSS